MHQNNVSLDPTTVNNFVYDMKRCIKCKGCTWVDHVYMPGIRFSTRCPSATKFLFDSYGAYGKMRIGLALVEGRLDYTDRLLEILYACSLCGACDAGCKRNLDLEIELALEALRIKAVKDGKGPLPAHRKAAQNILVHHNRFGAPQENRTSWLSSKAKPSSQAEIVYFAGCCASYLHTEIAEATVKILHTLGTPFMLLPDEWCCGNLLYSVGMVDEARKLAEQNIAFLKKSGASVVLTSCAECYRMLKVDYPKMFNISTADLGFKVVHLVEYVDDLRRQGSIKFAKSMDLRLAYHDACGLGRLSEPWVYWEGQRKLWGVVTPTLARRRGTYGVYQQPRDILRAIPGIELVEMIRVRENAWCCGAGRGTWEAFPDFALWAAAQRIEEIKEVGAEAVVSACPWCKDNLAKAAEKNQEKLKVLDISEIIAASI